MPRMNNQMSITEFNSLSAAEMKKEYNRMAERINKQVTRLKASGIDTKNVYTASDLKRATVYKANTTLTKKQLVKKYADLMKAKKNFTKREVNKRLEQNKKLAEAIGTTPENITPEQSKRFNAAVQRASTTGAYYYQVLRLANQYGVIDNYRVPDEVAQLSTESAIEWLLDKIDAEIMAKNKQERTPEDRAKMEQELRDAALRFELTTGEERRGKQPFKIDVTRL